MSDESIRDTLARAMRAQGKVNPDEVFVEADQLDLVEEEEAGREQDEQPTLPFDGEHRGYGWEPDE